MRSYPYSERASVILEAIRQSADLGVVYWSKSSKGFLRRVITPLQLDGYNLKAFDHSKGDIRVFKVTRLKTVEIVPRGSEKLPSRMLASGTAWSLGVLGVAAVALLVVALYRGRVGEPTSIGPPSSTNALLSRVATGRITIARASIPDGTGGTSTPTEITLPDVLGPTPPPAPKVIPAPERWEVVVYDHPTYDTNLVTASLQKLLDCPASEAQEYTRKVRAQGRAAVWAGRWTQAEVLRQTLEAEDIVAKVQLVAPTNAPAK
jgi:ATP-dependent Clp protease adapter protein ClpS